MPNSHNIFILRNNNIKTVLQIFTFFFFKLNFDMIFFGLHFMLLKFIIMATFQLY